MRTLTDDICDVLAANRYPGRGVLWARTLDGAHCGGFFLTGRSAASKARTVLRGDQELIVSPTTDSSHDPLRHYAAARERDGWLVFGNGGHVEAVSRLLCSGRGPAEALAGLSYEPDPPIYTPRITVVVDVRSGADADADAGSGRAAVFGAARRSRGSRSAADVVTLSVRDLEPGDVVLMTTYESDGDVVSLGAPYLEARTSCLDRHALLSSLWASLTPELRVAAAVIAPGGLASAGLVPEPAREFRNP